MDGKKKLPIFATTITINSLKMKKSTINLLMAAAMISLPLVANAQKENTHETDTTTPKSIKAMPIMKQVVVKRDRSKDAEREAEKKAFIGQQFTDLEMADVDGKMHKLSEYVGNGHWLFVDIWASWCGPCRAEMPNVVAAYEKYHGKGLEIVGLSLDDNKEAWEKAIKSLNMPWVHLSDLKAWKSVVTDVYKVWSIPDNLLIDPQGKIVARDLRGENLHANLKEIFGE